MNLAVTRLTITLGPTAYEAGNFVYVWLDGDSNPIYVGETGKSPADRAGLHIRDSCRSGAIVGALIQKRPSQQYTLLAFPIAEELLEKVQRENTPAFGKANKNRARKAIERAVYDLLSTKYELHPARGCKWRAEAATEFVNSILDGVARQAR